MKKFIFLYITLCLSSSTNAQQPSVTLTFTAVDNITYVQLDSIKVINRTRGTVTVLRWPDTALVLESTGNGPLFHPGDKMIYVGYADNRESGTIKAPVSGETFTFQLAINIPCPGSPTVEYEDVIYNTIQIYSQCWLKENLNVGVMIPGDKDMADNDVIEKYCYKNTEDSCSVYGGLYQWKEIMQYTYSGDIQGICPPDWHIPTNEEWKVLEGYVDSRYGIGDAIWDSYQYRGNDAGLNLKAARSWTLNRKGTDLYGFSALAAGVRHIYGSFNQTGYDGEFWTSSDVGYGAWERGLHWDKNNLSVVGKDYTWGLSVRCIRD
jgi:uncharacterized protein (TIGR02145 family)